MCVPNAFPRLSAIVGNYDWEDYLGALHLQLRVVERLDGRGVALRRQLLGLRHLPRHQAAVGASPGEFSQRRLAATDAVVRDPERRVRHLGLQVLEASGGGW